jgi:hypothetical protein
MVPNRKHSHQNAPKNVVDDKEWFDVDTVHKATEDWGCNRSRQSPNEEHATNCRTVIRLLGYKPSQCCPSDKVANRGNRHPEPEKSKGAITN